MKVGLAIIATVNAKALEGERSTDTLMNMLINYNPDFDARKYFLYGCNCIVSGDRPLDAPGFGRPINPLDALCKSYKNCIKCIQRSHGEACTPRSNTVRFKVNQLLKIDVLCNSNDYCAESKLNFDTNCRIQSERA